MKFLWHFFSTLGILVMVKSVCTDKCQGCLRSKELFISVFLNKEEEELVFGIHWFPAGQFRCRSTRDKPGKNN